MATIPARRPGAGAVPGRRGACLAVRTPATAFSLSLHVQDDSAGRPRNRRPIQDPPRTAAGPATGRALALARRPDRDLHSPGGARRKAAVGGGRWTWRLPPGTPRPEGGVHELVPPGRVAGLVRPRLRAVGAFSTLNSGGPFWLGVTVGGLVGVFFGLMFGGDHRWKMWDYVFGPKNPPPPRDGDPSEEWHG